MTRNPIDFTTSKYVVAAGKSSLSEMSDETLLPEAFLIRYCGWTLTDVKDLPASEQRTNRFGPFGPKSVKGHPLAAVRKVERSRAFRTRHTDPLHITESRLKSEHFFTDGLIAKWLGSPDLTADNPHYKKSAPMRLHRIGKILLLRGLPDVQADLGRVADQRSARSAGARAAAQRRQEEWISRFEDVEVTYAFPETYEKVRRLTKSRPYERHPDQEPKFWEEVDESTRERWMVNMLRHEYTDYDHILALDLPPGQAGRICYEAVKNRILRKIAETFPELRKEAENQML